MSFKPQRVQRKRSRCWRMPNNTVYVGRGTQWGNPYVIGDHGNAAKCVDSFTKDIGFINSRLDFEYDDIEQLRGKNLACWCLLDRPCHADVLLELANQEAS